MVTDRVVVPPLPLEENNIELLDMTGLYQLEQQLNSFLQQVKIREAKIEVDTHGTWGNRDVSSIQSRHGAKEGSCEGPARSVSAEIRASGKSLYLPFYWDKLPSITCFSVSRKLLLSASG
ncbi:hypothetical protein Tco_0620960, partial [Tanacetum coccineum]